MRAEMTKACYSAYWNAVTRTVPTGASTTASCWSAVESGRRIASATSFHSASISRCRRSFASGCECRICRTPILPAGADVQPLLTAADGTQLGVAICYEDAYGAEQLYALPDAGLLINVSNDAWFGDSIAPHQHLEIARMRSLEFGRPTVRSTNTGISAFIAADGELLQTGKQFAAELMTANVRPDSGMTPYAASGNLPIVGLCLVILGMFWMRGRASL